MRRVGLAMVCLGWLTGCTPGTSTEPGAIRAAEGGTLESKDGIFSLVIKPGSIAKDTTFTVAILAREKWPAGVDPATVIGELYDIQPSGITFNPPAVARWHYEAPTAPLATAEGVLIPLPKIFSSAGIEGSPNIETIVDADTTTVDILAEAPHLSGFFGTGDERIVPWASAPRNPPRFIGFTDTYVGDSWKTYLATFETGYAKAQVPFPTRVGFAAFTLDPSIIEVVGPEDWPSQSSLYIGRLDDVSPAEFKKASGRVQEGQAGAQGMFFPLLPDPEWKCVAVGQTKYGVMFFESWMPPGHGFARMVHTLTAEARCHMGDGYGRPPSPSPRAEVRVGDACTVTRSGDQFACGARETTLDVFALPAGEADRCRPSTADPDTLICSGVTGGASEGPAKFVLEWGELYEEFNRALGARIFTPIAPADPLGDAPSIGVFAEPKGGGKLEGVVLPLDPPVEDVLGEIEGLGTKAKMPKPVDPREVFFRGACRDNATWTDTRNVVIRQVPTERMTEENGVLTTPLIPTAVQAELQSMGITLYECTFGSARVLDNSSWFSGPAAVSAGRFTTVKTADLEPMSMLPPGVQQSACGALPATFTEYTSGATAVLCIDSSNNCRVTNHVDASIPLAPTQCPTNDRALVMNRAPSLMQVVGNSWDMQYASSGVDSQANVTTARADTDETVVVQRASDRARYKIDFRPTASGITVTSAAPFTTAFPAWGAAYDCLDTPQTLSSFVQVTADARLYARVCYENSTCKMHGHIEVTPENEICVQDYMLAWFHRTDIDNLFVRAGHPNQASWIIESTTAGTIDAGKRHVDMVPSGSDVTIVSSRNNADRYQTVFQWTGSAIIIKSITRM